MGSCLLWRKPSWERLSSMGINYNKDSNDVGLSGIIKDCDSENGVVVVEDNDKDINNVVLSGIKVNNKNRYVGLSEIKDNNDTTINTYLVTELLEYPHVEPGGLSMASFCCVLRLALAGVISGISGTRGEIYAGSFDTVNLQLLDSCRDLRNLVDYLKSSYHVNLRLALRALHVSHVGVANLRRAKSGLTKAMQVLQRPPPAAMCRHHRRLSRCSSLLSIRYSQQQYVENSSMLNYVLQSLSGLLCSTLKYSINLLHHKITTNNSNDPCSSMLLNKLKVHLDIYSKKSKTSSHLSYELHETHTTSRDLLDVLNNLLSMCTSPKTCPSKLTPGDIASLRRASQALLESCVVLDHQLGLLEIHLEALTNVLVQSRMDWFSS